LQDVIENVTYFSPPKSHTQNVLMVALLGRRDEPTDGVEDYCTFLGRALGARNIELRLARVPWIEKGWIEGLRWLAQESAAWRGKWVIVQFTALSWSRRGFPFFALAVLAILRRSGALAAVVFHEPYRQGGSRWIDRFRGACQDWVIRKLYRGATKAIFADPLGTIAWLPKNDAKSAFIPIGANVPEPTTRTDFSGAQDDKAKTVAVFCLTEAPKQKLELADISYAVQSAVANGSKLRVVFLGRGTEEAREEIARVFSKVPVEVSMLGILGDDVVSETLARSDAMLCVRDQITPRRGSVIAGIACGVPIVGYAGAAEGTPLAEAGIEFVPYRDREALGRALSRILTDPDLQKRLRERSLNAQQKFFSWAQIAASYFAFLERGKS
jgi:glycosyltransferase involved in cell wall biosynthesis